MANVTAITFNYILVIVFLFPLNVGVSPCFHCTVLVPVYRVYTSYFHNTQLLVPVTGYILPVCIIQVLLVSVWACGLIYSWNVSLVRSRWESGHIQFNFMFSLLCFSMMGLGVNFIMREVASSANSYANCQYIYTPFHFMGMF